MSNGRRRKFSITLPDVGGAFRERRSENHRREWSSPMGSSIPRKAAERIAYLKTRAPIWTANASTLKVSTSACADLTAKLATAETAMANADAARAASEAATLTLNDSLTALGSIGADLIKQIRATAQSTGDNSLYALAQIPAPATPSPVPAPGKSTDLKVQLAAEGGLDLSWKCPQPARASGTLYQVSRQLGTTGEFTLLGMTGPKKWLDNTLPAGTSQATYKIVAMRSTAQGPAALFLVNLGVGGTGKMTVTALPTPEAA
jgi:hypothetical protein